MRPPERPDHMPAISDPRPERRGLTALQWTTLGLVALWLATGALQLASR
ncbi:MAG TPA: hypothetical protein VEA99_21385 [Gemmatimonadaceae bacterium]|nr:hypothetical protein [Gemmatimonadaceae bacterium]